MNDELISACAALRADALHHLSLNSKELFHSNFLAWLAEHHAAVVAKAFAGLARSGDPGVGPVAEREKAHLDLVLRLPGLAPIVIENKVWSLPDDSQLERYGTTPAIKQLSATHILLSLTPPAWRGGQRSFGSCTWTYLSYRQLGDRLEGVVGDVVEPFDAELVARYVTMTRRICQVADAAADVADADLINVDGGVEQALRNARIFDGVSKLRAQKMARRILDRLASIDEGFREATPQEAKAAKLWKTGWTAFHVRDRICGVEATFTNGTPVLTGAVPVDSGDKLIWQLQGNQWRLAVQTGPDRYYGRDDKIRQQRHDYVRRQYDGWFDFARAAAIGNLPAGNGEPSGGLFNRYDPDFAYRYVRIDQGAQPLTIGQIVELGTYYLRAALDWQG